MLRFCANLSLLFNETGLKKRFRAAHKQGFSAVEIQFPYTLSVAEIQHELMANQLDLILFNVAADDLLQGGEGLACIPEKQKQFQQAVVQAVAYAEALKPNVINILPGRCFDITRKEAYLETFEENLVFALDAFSPFGIKTVFEAINTRDMPGFLIHSSQQMLAIMDRINHPMLAIQYDIYHMCMMGETLEAFIRQNSGRIGHIQFADCPGRGQPGTGNIDFASLFNAIENSTYTGWVGAEYRPTGKTEDCFSWFHS